jgi:hypothetical protein
MRDGAAQRERGGGQQGGKAMDWLLSSAGGGFGARMDCVHDVLMVV